MMKRAITGVLLFASVCSSYGESRWNIRTGPVYRHDMKASMSGSTIELGRINNEFIFPSQEIPLSDLLGDNPTLLHEIQVPGFSRQIYDNNGDGKADFTRYESSNSCSSSIMYIATNGYVWEQDTYSSIYEASETSRYSTEINRSRTTTPLAPSSQIIETTPGAAGGMISDSTHFSGAGWMLEGAYNLNPSNDQFKVLIGLQALAGDSSTLQAQTAPEQIELYSIDGLSNYVSIDDRLYTVYDDNGQIVFENRVYEEEHSHTASPKAFQISRDPLENSVEIDSSVDMYSSYLGLGMNLPLGESFAIGCAPRISAHLVDIDAERDELLVNPASGEVLSSWNESDDAQKFAWGLALALNASFDFNDQWFCAIEVMYDWVVEDVTHQIGPNELTYDLSAFQGAIQAGYRF